MAITDDTVSKGITVSFANISGVNLIDLEGPTFSRAELDFTHQGSGDWMESKPSPFSKGEALTLTFADNGTINPQTLITAATSTLTITMPVPDSKTNGAQYSGSAFVTNVSASGALGEKRTIDVEFVWAGEVTFTAAS